MTDLVAVLEQLKKERAQLVRESNHGSEYGSGNQFGETIGHGKSKEKVIRTDLRLHNLMHCSLSCRRQRRPRTRYNEDQNCLGFISFKVLRNAVFARSNLVKAHRACGLGKCIALRERDYHSKLTILCKRYQSFLQRCCILQTRNKGLVRSLEGEMNMVDKTLKSCSVGKVCNLHVLTVSCPLVLEQDRILKDFHSRELPRNGACHQRPTETRLLQQGRHSTVHSCPAIPRLRVRQFQDIYNPSGLRSVRQDSLRGFYSGC